MNKKIEYRVRIVLVALVVLAVVLLSVNMSMGNEIDVDASKETKTYSSNNVDEESLALEELKEMIEHINNNNEAIEKTNVEVDAVLNEYAHEDEVEDDEYAEECEVEYEDDVISSDKEMVKETDKEDYEEHECCNFGEDIYITEDDMYVHQCLDCGELEYYSFITDEDDEYFDDEESEIHTDDDCSEFTDVDEDGYYYCIECGQAYCFDYDCEEDVYEEDNE